MAKKIPQPHGGAINRFEKGDVGNPNGRPPKVMTKILRQMNELGYERVTPANVYEAYEIMLGLDRSKIKDLMKDDKAPMILRIVGKAMLGNRGYETIERMIDRAHGKAVQPVEQTTSIKLGERAEKLLKDLEDAENGKTDTKKVAKSSKPSTKKRKSSVDKGKPKAKK